MLGRNGFESFRLKIGVVATVLLGLLHGTEVLAIDVANQADWNTAVAAVAAAAPGSTVTINFTSGFTLTSSLAPILASSVNLTVNITGNNLTINGANSFQGISVSGANAPTVNISNLTISQAKALGGNGGSSVSGGGGGGLGAGGGLFVQTGANVTLQDVSFTNNKAQGGNGGASGLPLGGGGGGGGLNGGNGSSGGPGAFGSGGNGGSGPLFPGSGGSGGATGSNGTTGGGGGGGKGLSNTTGAGGAGGFGGGGGGAGYLDSGQGGAGGSGAGNGGAAIEVGTGTGGTGYGGAIFVMNGATLTIKASTNLTYSGNTTAQGTGGSPSATNGQDIYINGSSQVATFEVDSGSVAFAGSSQTSEGNIAGDGGITKTGAGTLVLGGANTYTGLTSINGGTLAIASAGNLGSTSGLAINDATLGILGNLTLTPNVVITTSGTIDVLGSKTGSLSGLISGNGGLVKSDTGILILANASNSFTGGTTVLDGILRAGVAGAFVNNTAYMVTGGTLDLNSFSLTASALNGTGGTVSLGTAALTVQGGGTDLFTGALAGDRASSLNLAKSTVLFLGGDDNAFLGTAHVGTGTRLVVNTNQFGGSVVVSGTLAGNGTIAGDVTLVDGVVSPSQNQFVGPTIPRIRVLTPTTLTIGGSFVQQAGGTYLVVINGAGQSDRLNIAGSATLAGALVVQALPGTYTLGTTYTILHAANGVHGTFGSFTDDLPMLSLGIQYTPNNVLLDIPAPSSDPTRPTFASFAQTVNQVQVGKALDSLQANGAAGMQPLINQLELQNAAGIQNGLQQLDGELFGSLASVKIQSSDLLLRSAIFHLKQMTAPSGGGMGMPSFGPSAGTPLAASDPSDLQRVAYAPQPEALAPEDPSLLYSADAGSKVVGWLQGVGAAGQLASDGNASGLDYSIAGTVFGADLRDGDAVVGIAGGYGHTDVSLNSSSDNGKIDSFNVALYALKRLEHCYALGLVGYASDSYSTRRAIDIGDISALARGQFMGNELQSYLETGLSLPIGRWTVQPLVGFRYLLLGQNGFTESGAGDADLSIADQTYDSLRYSIGLRLMPVGSLAGGWTPYLEGRWAHEMLSNSRLVNAEFAGIAGGSCFSVGNRLGRDFGEFNAGFSKQFSRHMQLFIVYDAAVSARQWAYGGTAGLEFTW